MKITPGAGVGELRFGFTKGKVKKLLGRPEHSERVAVDDEEWHEWHFDSRGLSLYFDTAADGRLVTIDVSDPAVELDGLKPIGLSEEQALAALSSFGEVVLEDEYPEHGRRVYDLVDTEVWFWFENERCDSVQVSAFLDEDGEYTWPSG